LQRTFVFVAFAVWRSCQLNISADAAVAVTFQLLPSPSHKSQTESAESRQKQQQFT